MSRRLDWRRIVIEVKEERWDPYQRPDQGSSSTTDHQDDVIRDDSREVDLKTVSGSDLITGTRGKYRTHITGDPKCPQHD
jgi:hypothetical protein